MSNDSVNGVTKKPSMLMKLVLPIVAGCLLTCCLSILVNSFQYGKKVVILSKNLDDYDKDKCIPPNNASKADMMQSLKWSIIPAILNLIIWGAIIWFVTKPGKTAETESDSNTKNF
jgi:hypothetical protein